MTTIVYIMGGVRVGFLSLITFLFVEQMFRGTKETKTSK